MRDPIKLSILALFTATLGLTIAFFLSGKPEKNNDTSEARSYSSAPDDRPDSQRRSSEIEPNEVEEHLLAELQDPAQATVENIVVIPVEGNPLVVTLLNYPELGQISIEEYSDEAGGFTGKPLKSGTKVQIMNPNKKGEKIQFILP